MSSTDAVQQTIPTVSGSELQDSKSGTIPDRLRYLENPLIQKSEPIAKAYMAHYKAGETKEMDDIATGLGLDILERFVVNKSCAENNLHTVKLFLTRCCSQIGHRTSDEMWDNIKTTIKTDSEMDRIKSDSSMDDTLAFHTSIYASNEYLNMDKETGIGRELEKNRIRIERLEKERDALLKVVETFQTSLSKVLKDLYTFPQI
jgi:hypothetical protein